MKPEISRTPLPLSKWDRIRNMMVVKRRRDVVKDAISYLRIRKAEGATKFELLTLEFGVQESFRLYRETMRRCGPHVTHYGA